MPTPHYVSKVLMIDPAANRWADQLLSVLNPILRKVYGDLDGPVASPSVVGLFGLPLSEAMKTPTIDDVIKWNGSAWVPGIGGAVGAVTAVTATGPLASSGGTTPDISLAGIVPVSSGGTNGSATPAAGAVAYGTGAAYAFSSVGSVGQVLLSNGVLSPIWSTKYFLPTPSSNGRLTYDDGTAWVALSAGVSGQFLSVSVAGIPSWSNATAGTAGAGIGAYRAVTSTPASVSLTDYVVDVTVSGAFTVTLPVSGSGSGQAANGRVFIVKNTGGATVTVATQSSQLIDGASSFVIVTQYASFTFVSTGSGWALT